MSTAKERAVVRFAEYEHPGEPEASAGGQRVVFLEALCEITPEVLKSLYDDVLPLYLTADVSEEQRFTHAANFRKFCDSLIPGSNYEEPDPYSEFAAAIPIWLDRWMLNTSWMHDCVVYSILRWSIFHEFRTDCLDWESPLYGLEPGLARNFDLRTMYRADLTLETRAEARKRIKANFQSELEEYLNLREQQAKEKKFEKVKASTTRDHHVWLIEFHVRGLNFFEIARRYKTATARDADRKEVSRAVRRLAKRLDLPIRPSQDGRPRKTGGN